MVKKTSSNLKFIREIKSLSKQIEKANAKINKSDKKNDDYMKLFNEANQLIHQKRDYIHPKTLQSLLTNVMKFKSKRLSQIIHILKNIDLLGNVKYVMSKSKDITQKINAAIKKKDSITIQYKNVFDGSVSDATISYKTESIEDFFMTTKDTIINYLKNRVNNKGSIKCYFILLANFSKMIPGFDDEDQQNEYLDFYLSTKTMIMNNSIDIHDNFDSLLNYFMDAIENVKINSSGWVFENTVSIEIKTIKYKPLRGSSYIELPEWIKNKKCCVNVKNNDNECFKWAVLSCLFNSQANQDKLYKVNQYKKFEDKVNWQNIKFPTKIDDIQKFEKNNETISINIFIIDNDSKDRGENRICPYYSSKYNDRTVINLLLIEDDKNNHYVWIKNFNRLMGCQNHHKVFYCTRCLQKYSSIEKLEEHKKDCLNNDVTKVMMPEAGSITQFKNFGKMLKVPFVYYADFESYLIPVSGCNNNNKKSFTDIFQRHEIASFCLYRVCVDPKYNKLYMYDNNKNVMNDFLTTLKESVNESYEILKNKKDMQLTPKEEKSFNKSNTCHICKGHINENDSKNYKVRDNDHITGIYRGPAHKNCNLQYRFNFKFPVYFHNLKGYDSHHIIKNIGSIIKNQEKSKLGCIPCNNEKYLSFNWDNINFVDTMQFMASSLDALASNLKTEDKKHVKTHFNNLTDEQFNLITQKGIFPYDWFYCKEKMNVDSLPSKDEFYSKLSECNIKNDEYNRALTVWNKLDCKTFKDYHDLYLKTDVLLLADVFENFRYVCYNNYGLDASHYLTAPGLAWDAALKMTGVKLELLTDYDKYLFVERGLRGGNSMIAHRYAKANNKYLPDYDNTKESSYIMYLDANNLYGWAMCEMLPYKNFNWVDVNDFDVDSIDIKSKTGYIIDCDLEYPESIHDLHNNYPLAPEKITVTNEMLSEFSQSIKHKLNMKDDTTSKLVCTLSDKNNYVLHIRNLKLYLSLGMKIKKINKVLSFKQKAWLKPYIEYNTNMRKEAKNDFEKDFYKLMNNSVFGKTMENVRNRIRFELIHEKNRLEKFAAKVTYKNHVVFGDNDDAIIGVNLLKNKTVLDKPIYVGMSILDLSKTLMYDFHYNTMMKQYNYNDVKLLFTDTDSLCYYIKADDIYNDIKNDKCQYDLSDYPKNHFLYDHTNKKVIGKFKDETNGIPISEFVGLRSKMYAFTYPQESETIEKKTCKGIKKYVIEKSIKFQNYKNCIFDESKMKQYSSMNTIRSKKHELYSIKINKVGLCSYDNKRYILNDNINTLAFGHYKTK